MKSIWKDDGMWIEQSLINMDESIKYLFNSDSGDVKISVRNIFNELNLNTVYSKIKNRKH